MPTKEALVFPHNPKTCKYDLAWDGYTTRVS
jgi:hypothetical protein